MEKPWIVIEVKIDVAAILKWTAVILSMLI